EDGRLPRNNVRRRGRSRKMRLAKLTARDATSTPVRLHGATRQSTLKTAGSTQRSLDVLPLTRAVQTWIKHDHHQCDDGDDRTNHSVSNFRAWRSYRNSHGRPGGQASNEGQGQRPEK